jgi:predicted house-cleaning noncanonical NTP pyrophosphatase (MazG superfamily)
MTEHGKLVRDRIPQIIEESGGTPATRILSDAERLPALLDKLDEESAELRAAVANAERLEELVDVLEVIRAIATEINATWRDVETAADAKRSDRGGFANGIWLSME